jgi:hypothetical protein
VDMKKLPLLFLLLLTACAGLPNKGSFVANCDYQVNNDNSLDLHCVSAGATLQPTATATRSSTPTTTSVPVTATYTPSPVPTGTATSVPTVTVTPVPSTDNLFRNPGFEGGATPYTWTGGLRLPEVATVSGWNPFMCDFPYKTGPCPALFQGTKNPSNLMMGRPEMRNTALAERIHGGSGAQYWFCQFRTCDGGVYQTVATVPGQVCVASAWVQSWSRRTWDDKLPIPVNLMSEFPNPDGYSNSLWRVSVDPYGGVRIDSSNVAHSSWYSLPHSIISIDGGAIQVLDHYDKYALLSYTFTARGSFATVYFENMRLFPFTFNDSMIDDASLVCSGGNGLPATVVPAATVTPTSTSTVPVVTPVVVSDCDVYPCYTNGEQIYRILVPTLPVHTSRLLDSPVVKTLSTGDEPRIHCLVEQSPGIYWGSVFACSPEPAQWFVIRAGQNVNAVALPGPEG